MLLLILALLTAGTQSHPLGGKPVTQVTLPACDRHSDCLYESKCYADGEEISRGYDGSTWCSGMVCLNGAIASWDNFNCGPSTTTPPSTTAKLHKASNPTTPYGCVSNGKWYPPGSKVSRGSDGEGNKHGLICGDDGQLVTWDASSHDKHTTPATTPPPMLTTPLGCFYNGDWYPPGSEVSRGQDGYGWCFGTYCDYNGQLVPWDDWNCGTTTEPPTTIQPIPPTTELPEHADNGCFYNGKWYPPGSDVSRGHDGYGWCFGTYCGYNRQLVAWDDFDCGTTTEPPTTIQPIPPTTRSPPPEHAHHGCFHNGKWYPPGSDITKGSDNKGWCYGTFCSAGGVVVAWDNRNCDEPPSPTTTPTPTTVPVPPPTTVPIPLGCFQNGAWYEPGSEISKESDEEGWCHGISCDSSGKIVAWDDWNCAATENSHPKTLQPTTPPKGCYYDNQWHPYGSFFEGSDSSGCKYGAMCDMDGKVLRWDEINCKPTD